MALRKPTRLNAHATMTAIQLAQNGIYACGRPEDTAAPIVIVVVSFDGFGSDHILPLHVDV